MKQLEVLHAQLRQTHAVIAALEVRLGTHRLVAQQLEAEINERALMATIERVCEILAEHDEKYLNHPPGAGSNMTLLMLCEDTIASIKQAVRTETAMEGEHSC